MSNGAQFWPASHKVFGFSCLVCEAGEECSRPRRARRDAIAVAEGHTDETGHETTVFVYIGFTSPEDDK